MSLGGEVKCVRYDFMILRMLLKKFWKKLNRAVLFIVFKIVLWQILFKIVLWQILFKIVSLVFSH